MKINWKVGCAFALAATILISGIGVASVYGAGKIEKNTEGSITLLLGNENLTELKTEKVTVHFYQVATVKDNGVFESNIINVKNLSSETTASDWETLAEEAMNKVQGDGTTITDTFDKIELEVTGEAYGLYLMKVDPVETATYKYEFKTVLVSVPGNNYYDTNDDSWVYNVTATLKPEYSDLYGSIKIDKTLTNFNESLNNTSTVFSVVAKKNYDAVNGGAKEGVNNTKTVYNNVVAIDFATSGTNSCVIDGIPAGSEVTITEVYSGATYEQTLDENNNPVVVIKNLPKKTTENGAPVVAAFTNDYNDKLLGNGTAAVNQFSYDNGWSWSRQRVVEPAKPE